MYYGYRHRKKSNKYGRVNWKLLLIPLFFIVVSICILIQFDRKILPSAAAISHMQAKNMANKLIDASVKDTLDEMKINSSDFFIDSGTGAINSFSANTMLINEVCANVSTNISTDLEKLADERIDIPFGVLSGIEILSNIGPDISFSLMPMGEVAVDYDTSFNSVGINQTNFKIWMNVNIAIQIVNPLKKEKIVLERKLMLVDTVINGEVPGQYLEFGM